MHGQSDFRTFLAKGRQQQRKRAVEHGRPDDADVNVPGFASPDIAREAHSTFGVFQHVPGFLEKRHAGIREFDAPFGAEEEAGAELCFERLDLLA